MITTGTAATYQDCATGCPHCGCSNPNCRYGPWGDLVLDVRPYSPLREEIETLKQMKRVDRPWVDMKQAPRRYRG